MSRRPRRVPHGSSVRLGHLRDDPSLLRRKLALALFVFVLLAKTIEPTRCLRRSFPLPSYRT